MALAIALLLIATAGGVWVGHAWHRALVSPTKVEDEVPSYEACLAAAIDVDRQQAGLAALSVDPTLSSYSRSHSTAMAAAGTIFHSGGSPTAQIPNDDAFRAAIPAPYRADPLLGENVGEDPNGCADMNTVYMNSPEHRANILDAAWTGMAVGVAFSPDGIEAYTTEDFFEAPAKPPAPPIVVPTTRAPAAIAQSSPKPSPKPSPRVTSCAG